MPEKPTSAVCFLSSLLLWAAVMFPAQAECEDGQKTRTGPAWRVLALEYGFSTGSKATMLVRDAKEGERAVLGWYAWLILSESGGAQRILVDTGFAESKLAEKWGMVRFDPVPVLLDRLGIDPSEITDVVITHCHWDHMGNVSPYDRARFWVQRSAFDWAVRRVAKQRSGQGAGSVGIRPSDVMAMETIQTQGRLNQVSGVREIAPGVILRRGGGHSPGIQWVEIQTGGATGTVVLASDNAYLYENLERRVPTGSTATPGEDLLLFKNMLAVASRPVLVIPGHDPLVAKRFPKTAEDIVEIRQEN